MVPFCQQKLARFGSRLRASRGAKPRVARDDGPVERSLHSHVAPTHSLPTYGYQVCTGRRDIARSGLRMGLQGPCLGLNFERPPGPTRIAHGHSVTLKVGAMYGLLSLLKRLSYIVTSLEK